MKFDISANESCDVGVIGTLHWVKVRAEGHKRTEQGFHGWFCFQLNIRVIVIGMLPKTKAAHLTDQSEI
jgi:hypothetical protein